MLLMTYFLYRTDTKLQDAIKYFIPKFQGFVLDMYELRDKLDEHIEYGKVFMPPEDAANKFVSELELGIKDVEERGYYEKSYFQRHHEEMRRREMKFKRFKTNSLAKEKAQQEEKEKKEQYMKELDRYIKNYGKNETSDSSSSIGIN